MYNILTRNNLVLRLHNFEGIKIAKDHKIKFYVDYPLSSFEEIQEAVIYANTKDCVVSIKGLIISMSYIDDLKKSSKQSSFFEKVFK